MTAAALAVFKQYPDAREVFVTEDAQAFLVENYARNHARQAGMPMPVRIGRHDAVKADVLAEAKAKAEAEQAAAAEAEAKAKAEAEQAAAAEAEAKAKAEAEQAKKSKKK